ncbi:Uncharacterized protein SCF082_LOCUS43797 [Durusdinium trenchii]|uniref:DNA (cytosine-5-)-methyltransferase n=1 Tax=Durusdinium trenchii TaxID=1381693 RepID=A0ABP0QYF7_9DINO
MFDFFGLILRYDVIAKRLGKLGYAVHGDEYNAADFGLPQQRRRAWLLCVQECELATSTNHLSADMNLFRRLSVPLAFCVDMTLNVSKERKNVAAKKTPENDPKWKAGFESQCEIYGKEVAALQGVGFSDWQKYEMGKEPERLIRGFAGNGEIIGARLVPDDQINLDGDYKQGQLRFDDGGMRGLACGLCWCGLVHFVASLPEDVCAHPSVVELARSLLHLPTCFKSAASDESSNMIKRIIRQNVDSKKLPVSSFEWSQILASLRKNGKQLSVAEAIDLYNANPEVQAHGGRPLSSDALLLPLSRDIIVPESLSAEADLKQALELRLKDAEYKGGFKTSNLFYHSIWFLNKESFGHARLTREVTDAWITRRFSHGGQQFTMEPPALTAADLEAIPGSSLEDMDKMKFEVLERTGPGTTFTIKVDEHKFWSMQTGVIGDQYKELREKHQQLIGRCAVGSEKAEAEPESEENAGAAGSATEMVELESVSKLEETLGIEVKCNSEVSSVQLILAKDSSIWLCSTQDRSIGKCTVLGGFGTGQWVSQSQSDSQPGIDFVMPSDRTLVQLDEASFSSEGQGVSTSTLFKLLVRAEREKGVVEHRVSFLTISRKEDAALEEAGCDGFNVTIKTPMTFRCMRDPRVGDNEDKVTSKNFFAKALAGLAGSGVGGGDGLVSKIFRYRFERVGQNFKVQRPYVITNRVLTLKQNQPLKISKA